MEELEFETKDELKEILSSLPTETLYSISKEINVKWKRFEGEVSSKRDINRMRCYLAICEHYFPKKHRKPQKNSGWKGKEMDELLALVDKFNLKRPKGGNEKICKMWCIRRLNDAGVDPITEKISKVQEV
jgi:hypothetical protein